jgi:hypothetical protein
MLTRPRLPATTCQQPRQETTASTTAAPAADRHSSTLGIPTAGVGHIKKKHILGILQTLASDYSILFYFVGDEERLTVEQDDMVDAYPRMGRFSTGDSRHLPLYIKYCRNTTDVGI